MSDGNGDDDDDDDNDDNDQLRYLQDALRKLAVKKSVLEDYWFGSPMTEMSF